ncbi:MAG: NUDIX hydrolase [Gammaproteobacteria bacterium]|nr:NUDIX hydrolase [Gammaproteobacteria bacterium]
MLELFLKDDEYETRGTKHERVIVRAILINEDGKVALCHLHRNDEFGNQEYYETPGGGVEMGEDLIDALRREIDEEVGVTIKDIKKIGVVNDYYNLISRNNINNYYLCRVDKKTKIHHESYGDTIIEEIVYISLDEALNIYQNMEDSGVSKLVKQRELPILLEAIKILNNE